MQIKGQYNFMRKKKKIMKIPIIEREKNCPWFVVCKNYTTYYEDCL